MSVSGNPFGGGGCYSPAWERLLEFCPVAPELICAGSAAALAAWPWGYPPGANDSSEPLETRLRAARSLPAHLTLDFSNSVACNSDFRNP